MNKFGEYLKVFMEKRDLKLEYAAEKIGVSFGSLGHYIKGRRSPSYKFLEKFFNAFNIGPEEQQKIITMVEEDKMPEEMKKLKKEAVKIKSETDTSVLEVIPGNAKRIKTVKIPMYGTASAGPGYYNLSVEVEDFLIPEEDYRPGRFAVKVEGESMTGPGKSIPCGSIALVDPNMCSDIEELINKVCVFTYNDETYIKQLIIDNQNLVHLVSFNPEISDIIVINHKDLKCDGRVVKTYFEQKW